MPSGEGWRAWRLTKIPRQIKEKSPLNSGLAVVAYIASLQSHKDPFSKRNFQRLVKFVVWRNPDLCDSEVEVSCEDVRNVRSVLG